MKKSRMIAPVNLLLEVGCEEIPARFLPGFLEDLKKKTEDKLNANRLTYDRVVTLGTARRLTLFVERLSPAQPSVTNEVKGPPAEIAFDASGNPTAAALGFAKTQGIAVESLTVRPVSGRNYIFAKVTRRGEKSEKLLPNLLPEIVLSLYQPLAMRWGTLDLKFIRPIHSLLALYGHKTVKFELGGITSGNRTFGHRYFKKTKKAGGSSLKKADLELYKKTLAGLGVIVDQNERKALVQQKVLAAAKKAGGEALVSPELLNEVTFLLENPEAYVGKFDPAFLLIPSEVLITSMKKNQKYFPLTELSRPETKGPGSKEPRLSAAGSTPPPTTGKLLPMFVVVTDNCRNPRVVEGNQKVLSARLADARFFFEEDKKIPLADRLPELERVAWLEKLGNLKQKSDRLVALVDWLGKRIGLSEAERQICRRIAELCKADLTTKMVFEFPELQGVMGREYARLSGEPAPVALGIFEHYLPRSVDDQLPSSLPGAIVAVADRFDSLVGAFAAGHIPTGSQDPYGCRRAALGIIKIILQHKLDLLLDESFDHLYQLYGPILKNLKNSKNPTVELKKEVMDFIAGRLRPLLLDEGIRYDVVDAALAGFNDILDVAEKARTLNTLLTEPWLKGVCASADRLSRIAGNASREQVFEHDLVEEEEKALYALYLQINGVVRESVLKEDWRGAANQLSQLTEPIEKFFDKILVMHQEERIKSNRLALLKSLANLYLAVADFRKIVLEGEKK